MHGTLIAPPRPVPDHRTLRLAELVQHLTGAAPVGALHAVEAQPHPATGSTEAVLDVVARAIVSLRHLDRREAPQALSTTGTGAPA